LSTYKIEKSSVNGIIQNEKYEKIFLDHKNGKYPVANDGNFNLGDLRSSVAVVLPTPDHSLEMLSIEHGAAIAGSVNTSSSGIEHIIANIVSNPNIRFIIVYGDDGPNWHPGQSLICLKDFGVDKKGFIINADNRWGAHITHIEKKAIELFREQIINVVDLLGEDDSTLLSRVVYACIQEPENAEKLTTGKGKEYVLYDPGPLNHEPVYLPILEGTPGSVVDKIHDPLCSLIIAEDISQAYKLLWASVRAEGKNVLSEFGSTKELLNCVVQIRNPLKNYLALVGDKSRQIENERISNYMFQDEPVKESLLQDYLEKYFQTLMTHEKIMVVLNRETNRYQIEPNPDAKYTYGERIRGYQYRDERGEIKIRDNLDIVVQALANSIKRNANTRRCGLSLINPVLDLTIDLQDIDPPCITTLFFNPREVDKGRWILYGTMIMRSHDVRRAFVANVYAFSTLTKHVCEQINEMLANDAARIEMGPVTIFFVSAHEYISKR
jgi:tetrahydromethanopterin S-methyltransferase subunit A/thymidylate synthase